MPSYEKDNKIELNELLFNMAVACENLMSRSKENTDDVRVIIESVNRIYIELFSRK